MASRPYLVPPVRLFLGMSIHDALLEKDLHLCLVGHGLLKTGPMGLDSLSDDIVFDGLFYPIEIQGR